MAGGVQAIMVLLMVSQVPSRGALEDFLVKLVPDPLNDNLWELSEKCVNKAITLEPQIPKDKARIRTYLAWKKEPGTSLGKAIEYGYLDATKPEAIQFLK